MNYQDVVSNVKVYGFEDAVKGAKYSYATDINKVSDEVTKTTESLACSPAGSGHDQFMTGIVVQFDLTFSNKAWVEVERYKFLNFVSSQSTMHRITKFNLDEVYMEYTDPRIIAILDEPTSGLDPLMQSRFIELIEEEKEKGNDVRDLRKEADLRYLEILYSNPAGFRLTAKMTTNYRALKTIYHQRKDHRLPEWKAFCAWVETLPYAYFITGKTAE